MPGVGRYVLAVLGYVALSMLTKHFMSGFWGLLYFVVVLEVLPRTWRRARALSGRPVPPSGDAP